MALKLKKFLAGIVVFIFISAGPAAAADFDITLVSGGENPTITIQNNSNFSAYVYDLIKADGTKIIVHTEVINSATLQVTGDLAGVVEARCVAAENAFEGWEDYMSNPDSDDGFFHYSAAVF